MRLLLFSLACALALAGCAGIGERLRRAVSEVDEGVSFSDKGLNNPRVELQTKVFFRDPALAGLKK